MSKLSRKDVILIIITIVLFLIMIGGFLYDRNEALLDRTNLIAISQDDNLRVVKMEKIGFLYSRQAYEARVLILNGVWQPYIEEIQNTYDGNGLMMYAVDFQEYSDNNLSGVTVKPQPSADSLVYTFGSTIKVNSPENVVYIIDQEDDGNAYLYIYYSKNA